MSRLRLLTRAQYAFAAVTVVQCVKTIESHEVATPAATDEIECAVPRLDPIIATSGEHKVLAEPREEDVGPFSSAQSIIARAAAYPEPRSGYGGRVEQVVVAWASIE